MLIEIDEQHLVPKQVKGTENDAIETVTLDSFEQAESFYALVRSRLLDVNSWGEISELPLSSFKLFDSSGKPVNRFVRHGDFIRIDIPGPGTHVGMGFDWVRVDKIKDKRVLDKEQFSIRVRPSYHPLDAGGRIAHFLSDCSTSTFQVKRIGNEVSAEQHGRNEKANLAAGNCLDNFRNLVIGTLARMGLSYPQWKSLIRGLLK